MHQTGYQMLPLLALGLVWLICESTTVRESATGTRNNRKPCLKIGNDTCEPLRRENHLPDAGRSYCGERAFNPENATCCKDGYTNSNVTEGLSEKVSACCGLMAYDQLNEICCNSKIIAKPGPNAQCCDSDAFDVDKQMCCGPMENKTILMRKSRDHLCCGHDQFDPNTEWCCLNEGLKTQPNTSMCCVNESAVCGTIADNEFNKLGYHLTVVSKPAPKAKYCEKNAYDEDKQMCCGPVGNKTILMRKSRDHLCCGHDQFDPNTECCFRNEGLKIQPITSMCCVNESDAYDVDKYMCCGPVENKTILMRKSRDHLCCGHDQFDPNTECCCRNESLKTQPNTSMCCVNESGVQQPKTTPQPNCTEPNTGLCGSSCYNPSYFRCCERNQGKSQRNLAGQLDDASTVYDPRTHVCWDGFVSEWTSWIEQSDASPGQHCCGTEVYCPHKEICCDGQRHDKKGNAHCCGGEAYDIKDPQMKCCAGKLHNLTLLGRPGHDAQCCGSILQSSQDVCCSSEDKEVLYSAKTGFLCCSHLYYNTSLWSCCAGMLSPVHKAGQHQNVTLKESRLLSLNNLNESSLCNAMQIGTMESVSPCSIVFSNVLKIHGRNASVKHLDSLHILQTPDHCSAPKLIPGNSYFFNEDKVFTDYNHNSVLQSLYFIFSKCYRP